MNLALQSPTTDLDRLHESIRSELDAAIADVLDQGSFTGPLGCSSFEAAFGRWQRREHVVGTGSAGEAVDLALRAVGVGPGDEVIVSSLGSPVVPAAIIALGATPRFADVDEEYLALTETTVDAVSSDRTTAIMPDHFVGRPLPFDILARWATSGRSVIEVAFDACGARWRESPVGTVGHAAIFDLGPRRVLGALGSAGVVATDDPEVAADVSSLRAGGDAEVTDLYVGTGMDALQAAVLEVKLRHIDEWMAARRQVVHQYAESVRTRAVGWEAGATHEEYPIRVPAPRRDSVVEQLRCVGVDVRVPPPALSRHLGFAAWASPCEVAEAAASELIMLPVDPFMTPDDVTRIADGVNALV